MFTDRIMLLFSSSFLFDKMIKELKNKLKEVITKLEYEEAVHFRDEIKELRENELELR